jgi:hypothetical protein
MRASTLLRLASILAAIQGIAAAILVLRFRPSHGPAEASTIADMQAHVFNFGGFHHTYWQMYVGYELFVVLACFIQAILLDLLAPVAAAAPRRTAPVILTFALANAAYAMLMLRYVFALPALFDLFLAFVLAWAFLAARRAGRRA